MYEAFTKKSAAEQGLDPSVALALHPPLRGSSSGDGLRVRRSGAVCPLAVD